VIKNQTKKEKKQSNTKKKWTHKKGKNFDKKTIKRKELKINAQFQ
jgi:hypothetical protein